MEGYCREDQDYQSRGAIEEEKGKTLSSDALIFNPARKYIPNTRLVCVHPLDEARNKLSYQVEMEYIYIYIYIYKLHRT
jgi:hypothetical protein